MQRNGKTSTGGENNPKNIAQSSKNRKFWRAVIKQGIMNIKERRICILIQVSPDSFEFSVAEREKPEQIRGELHFEHSDLSGESVKILHCDNILYV